MRYLKYMAMASIILIAVLSMTQLAIANWCIIGNVYYEDCGHFTPGDYVTINYRPTLNDPPRELGTAPIFWSPGIHLYTYEWACPIEIGYYQVVFHLQCTCNAPIPPVSWRYFDGQQQLKWSYTCCLGHPNGPEQP